VPAELLDLPRPPRSAARPRISGDCDRQIPGTAANALAAKQRVSPASKMQNPASEVLTGLLKYVKFTDLR